MTAVCREGHVSDEPDYCSVCGAPITMGPQAAPNPAPPRAAPIPVPKASYVKDTGTGTCPSCGEPREDPDARYCEVCRYDFVDKRPGPPPVARAVPAAAAAPAQVTPVPATPSPAPAVVAQAWELVVRIDPSLDTEPDPDHPCPADPPVVLAVDKADMLIGRLDETRDIRPEVALRDPGASRRHAKFVLDPDGGIALQDLASTNGTQVNGQDVPPGTRKRLRDGDSVTLGRWTRIDVRSKA